MRQALAAGAVAFAVAAVLAPRPASGAAPAAVRLPAAGELVSSRLAVRAAPDARAKVVRLLHRLRPDQQFAVVLAVAARRAPDGRWWYELSLPGRPNGQRGWADGQFLDLHPVRHRIVVRVGERRIVVRRIADNRVLLRGVVAVGKPGAETPLGRDFFVEGRFVPSDPFFGAFVLETSAYSKLSDWPGGGLAGIHGTNQPQLLGRAVSHGCVRVSDAVARGLERLAPLGTPIDLLP
ncbi:MAG: L,D-transpeptidase [Gaiellaceae bacterium]